MLAQLSWKNVWRNKVRTLVLVSSIALGIWAGTFILSFSWGMSSQYVNIAIKGQISHLQIHNPKYKKDKNVKYYIPQSQEIIPEIKALSNVVAVSGRMIVNGMISSTASGVGVNITGIDPVDENEVTGMGTNLFEGDYFKSSKRNQIIIGEKLSHKLKVKINNKIVLTFQDATGTITAGAFRITGIFKTRNSTFDETNVFVKSTELNALVGLPAQSTHEIAILLNNNKNLNAVHGKLSKLFPALLIEDWQEIAPELRFVIDSFDQTMYLFIGIILLALAFGIVNTMLMSVLERVRELGILMAIGMNKFKVFFMIMLETFYITLIGGPLGILMAYFTIHYFGNAGINLSAFSKGLESYGMDPIVYPVLALDQYMRILLMVFIAAILAAIYPSVKALKLKPVKAIRKI